jgi:DNA-binding GntR family transcriptional regulator
MSIKLAMNRKLQAESAPTAGPAFEIIAEMIARDIQSGALAPGQWLKQIDLETRYQARRPDVRRALDRLVEKRLAEHLPNRGYHVYAADDQRADEIRDLRIILETAAVDGMIERASAHSIEAARALARRFEALVLGGTILELYDANLAFHQHMLELCGNRELVNVVKDLRSRVSSAPASQWQKRSRIDQSNAEHFDMVEALAAGDGERLRAIVRAHIRQTPR